MKNFDGAESEDYELLERVGRSRVGVVYRAVCPTRANEECAVKIIDLERHGVELDAFWKEMRALGELSHPTVLKYHRAFLVQSSLYLIMPYAAGGSCLNIMRDVRQDGFDETFIATVLLETVRAVKYIHENNYIHRNIKAANILIDGDGHVKLADFGGSASLLEGGDRVSARNTFIGDLHWMAPEVMEQVQGYDYKADIWSIGITAIELACAHEGFFAEAPLKVMHRLLQGKAPHLVETSERKFSKSFHDFVACCLQRDPEKRPTAGKLLEHKFLRSAKKPEYIRKNFVEKLPSLGKRFRSQLAEDGHDDEMEGPLPPLPQTTSVTNPSVGHKRTPSDDFWVVPDSVSSASGAEMSQARVERANVALPGSGPRAVPLIPAEMPRESVQSGSPNLIVLDDVDGVSSIGANGTDSISSGRPVSSGPPSAASDAGPRARGMLRGEDASGASMAGNARADLEAPDASTVPRLEEPLGAASPHAAVQNASSTRPTPGSSPPPRSRDVSPGTEPNAPLGAGTAVGTAMQASVSNPSSPRGDPPAPHPEKSVPKIVAFATVGTAAGALAGDSADLAAPQDVLRDERAGVAVHHPSRERRAPSSTATAVTARESGLDATRSTADISQSGADTSVPQPAASRPSPGALARPTTEAVSADAPPSRRSEESAADASSKATAVAERAREGAPMSRVPSASQLAGSTVSAAARSAVDGSRATSTAASRSNGEQTKAAAPALAQSSVAETDVSGARPAAATSATTSAATAAPVIDPGSSQAVDRDNVAETTRVGRFNVKRAGEADSSSQTNGPAPAAEGNGRAASNATGKPARVEGPVVAAERAPALAAGTAESFGNAPDALVPNGGGAKAGGERPRPPKPSAEAQAAAGGERARPSGGAGETVPKAAALSVNASASGSGAPAKVEARAPSPRGERSREKTTEKSASERKSDVERGADGAPNDRAPYPSDSEGEGATAPSSAEREGEVRGRFKVKSTKPSSKAERGTATSSATTTPKRASADERGAFAEGSILAEMQRMHNEQMRALSDVQRYLSSLNKRVSQLESRFGPHPTATDAGDLFAVDEYHRHMQALVRSAHTVREERAKLDREVGALRALQAAMGKVDGAP